MPIVEDEKGDSESIINTDKLINLISLYKFPIILTCLGVVFLLAGFIYIFKMQNTSSEVIFSSSSTSSAILKSTKLWIDIEGEVINPGVYEMSEGERISDALVLAGGLSADADRDWVAKNLNRAAKLTDGGKLYIPSRIEISSGKTPASAEASSGKQNSSDSSNPSNLLGVTTGKVNINSASRVELENLPGVGPVTAGKIIAGRPYQAVEDLKTKKSVGNALFEKIKDLIVVY